jgi:hypothetical protein
MLARDFEHARGGFVVGDNLAEVVMAAGLLHVVAHAHAQGEHLARAVEGGDHVGKMEGLDEVVEGAELHGFNGAVDHVVGSHHQDDGGGVGLLEAAEDFDAVDAGENDVEQGEVGLLLGEDGESVFAGSGREDFKALLAQATRNGAEGQVFVVDYQDGVGHGSVLSSQFSVLSVLRFQFLDLNS